MTQIDIHMVNVRGLGARRFVNAVLSSLTMNGAADVSKVFCNEKYAPDSELLGKKCVYRRYKFGYLSRLSEIIFWRFKENSAPNLLVMGDLPLNTGSKQFIICQQALMFSSSPITSVEYWKYALFRFLFGCYLKSEDVVIVQTETMRKKVADRFGEKINIQVLDSDIREGFWPSFRRKARFDSSPFAPIRVLYPAAFYPHKNHAILHDVKLPANLEIILTVSQSETQIESKQIVHIGRQSAEEVFDLYKTVDGLLFLSLEESLGLPLLEAVGCNLPIICANADYSESLCAENTFWFDARDPDAISTVLHAFTQKIEEGWWSEWYRQKPFGSHQARSISEIIRG